MKRIVLLRHGESLWNQENRFTGWTDVDLSEKGVVEEVVSKRWHTLFYILQFCYIFFWLCCFFLMHLATSCYIPIISGYK